MAGAAEGVWLDSESIHPIDSDCTIGRARFYWRGSDLRFAAKSREVSSECAIHSPSPRLLQVFLLRSSGSNLSKECERKTRGFRPSKLTPLSILI